jgi:hypothetical protein
MSYVRRMYFPWSRSSNLRRHIHFETSTIETTFAVKHFDFFGMAPALCVAKFSTSIGDCEYYHH